MYHCPNCHHIAKKVHSGRWALGTPPKGVRYRCTNCGKVS